MPLAGSRPAWIVARTFTRPRSAMRRIVQSPTEGSANEGNHGRLVVTPATRLGGEVQPAAPAFQAAPAPAPGVRPCVRGKFLFVGDEKLYVRGVTYGAFTPDAAGNEYHDLATVERDFAQMAANGINAVRIPHTTPPRALLDIASHHRLPFLDFVCFNVYLESQDRFEAYLARLQNIAGDRPLLMSELGLDALRNGEGGQARSLDWQVRTAFAAGCGGVFVFAWTDEWYRHEIGRAHV